MKTGESIVLNEQDILRAAVKSRGITQEMLAERMGMLQSALSQNMRRTHMTVEKFKDILGALGYDIYIVDRETKEAPWALDN